MPLKKLNAIASMVEKAQKEPKKKISKGDHKKSPEEAKKDAKKEGESVEHEMSESKEFEAAEDEGKKELKKSKK